MQIRLFGAAGLTRIARNQARVAFAMLLMTFVYLVPFVGRGWFPHDEGMIGQSAERVLRGEIPHVNYDEPYTGVLTLFHAAVFKVLGADLVNPRWALLVGAVTSMVAIYLLFRPYLRPIAAAAATWLAIAWSFPNYFASLPSWWLLISALFCLAAMFRFIETNRLQYVALAGLAVGTAIVIKQTGLYFVVPLAMTLLLRWNGEASESGLANRLATIVRTTLALGSLAFAMWIMRHRLGPSEIVYLLVPITACSLSLIFWNHPSSFNSSRLRLTTTALVAASLPLALVLGSYVSSGHLGDFVKGAFQAPQLRLTFASAGLPPAPLILLGPLLFLAFVPVPASLSTREASLLRAARWPAAAALLAFSLRFDLAYIFIWQSSRSLASLLPVVTFALITFSAQQRGIASEALFAASSMLAWASLVQFPFGAPIYFCYVAPFAVLTVVLIVTVYRLFPVGDLAALFCLLLSFAVISMNRSYPGAMGITHRPMSLDVPLDLEKATLTVSARDADTYQRVTSLVNAHLGPGGLVAGPDCPEVYFLTNEFSPTGALFDFLGSGDGTAEDLSWLNASVVVINHGPHFSLPLAPSVVTSIRAAFRNGESVGVFEVRWKEEG